MKNHQQHFGPGFTAQRMMQNILCRVEDDAGGGGAALIDAPPANDPPEAPPVEGGRSPLGSLADGFAKLNGREGIETRPGAGKVSIPAKDADAPIDDGAKPTGDAPKIPAAPAAKVTPSKPIEGLSDPASLQLPGAKGKAAENWNKIHAELTTAHGMIQKDRERIAELETALSTEKTKWEDERKKLSGEVETLRPFRAITDEQNTPEFQEKFDKPVNDAQKEMANILKKVGIKEEEFTKFLPSVAAMQNIATQLSEAGYKTESRLLENRIEKMADSQLKRDQAIEDFKSNHSKIVESRKAEMTAKQVQAADKAKTHLETQWNQRDDKGQPKYPFFNEVKIAPDATEDAKKQAEQYNDGVRGMREQMRKWLALDTPESKAEMAMGTMIAAVFSNQLKQADARIKSLETELGKISKAGSAPTSPNPNRESSPAVPRGTSLGEAFMGLNGRN